MSKIYVVGIGPGSIDEMTPRARAAIEDSDVIIGYNTYVDLIKDHFPHKEFVYSGMTKEVERCNLVLEKALEGMKVALISSGDCGVYGMAGIMLEIVVESKANINVEIIAGITAANAAAAILGSPLTNDFAVISLSDLLTPVDVIENRVKCAAAGDFAICLYNPKSKKRTTLIEKTREMILSHRRENTPVGIVRNAGRPEEHHIVTTLGEMLNHEIDMFTIVLIGNSTTYVKNGRMITPRGYKVED